VAIVLVLGKPCIVLDFIKKTLLQQCQNVPCSRAVGRLDL